MAKPDLIRVNKTTSFDNSGLVQPGSLLFTYVPGTTTKQNTYPTSANATAGTNPNPNPMVADASGRFTDMWATASYKQVMCPSTDTDPPTNPYWTVDNIPLLAQTITTSHKTSLYTVLVSDRDTLFTIDTSAGGFNFNLLPAATAGSGFRIALKKMDSSSNAVTIVPNGSDNIDGSNTSFTLSVQNDYMELTCDGTQWFKSSPKTFSNNVSLVGGSTYIIADGFQLANRMTYEILIPYSSLASAAKVTIVPSSGSQQFKIRDIRVGRSSGLSGGSGDRNLAITDGTLTWTVITATLLGTPVLTTWGNTNVPGPTSAFVEVSATVAGAVLYAQYSGGTTDYTAGNVELIVTVDKVA